MRIFYESKVDFQQYANLVYCNPSFHGCKRYDFIIVQTTSSFIFAQLLKTFSISIADRLYTICLIQLLDAPISTPPTKDCSLRLRHVHARSRNEFIFT
ncbi:hypothetical protein BJV74DRAFT_771101 [Russula compacta]|nr:hypothetical protein BJV74DRAFT_771101 [Russula compacta]